MTNEPTEHVDEGHPDLLAFLERLERENLHVAAATIDREVDDLLGRTPAATPAGVPGSPAHALNGPPRRAPARSAFAWYQPISTRLPPVLVQERMIEAAKAVEVGLFAQERLDTLDGSAVTRRDLRDLHDLAEHGRAEYELLIYSNVRLVFHWCKGIATTVGEDWVQDAFQAGCIGLIRGVQGWDHSKGYALSTYVSWHIRQRIQRWRMDETAIIRIPVHVWEKLESHSSQLTVAVETAALRALKIVPLDDVEEDNPAVIWDGGLDDIPETIDRTEIVARMMSVLSEREANVLRLRNGLHSSYDEPLTLDAIGAMYGLTRERIRQIEKTATKKITADPTWRRRVSLR